MIRNDMVLMVCFAVAVLAAPVILAPVGAGYPDLLQKFAIFGIFAIGFNILFGLTGYLSFGHAAFLGVGSYTAVWVFKLFSMNPLPAILFATLLGGLFAVLIGYICLRRSGIYFSILTLAFVQMSYNLGYPGFYFCAVLLILCFFISIRIFRSPFGMMLRAVKSNQNRLNYTGVNTRPYAMAAFVISGMYAGLAGGLLAVTDPLAGAERMQWTASGEVVLMTILGGAGTLIGPILGAGVIKYFENIFSSFNDGILMKTFDFLPESLQQVMVSVSSVFVGEGWHLTLGVLFMMIVIFLPGGLMEGFTRIKSAIGTKRGDGGKSVPAAGSATSVGGGGE